MTVIYVWAAHIGYCVQMRCMTDEYLYDGLGLAATTLLSDSLTFCFFVLLSSVFVSQDLGISIYQKSSIKL